MWTRVEPATGCGVADLEYSLTLELLAKPRCPASVGAVLPRDETDDMDVLRSSAAPLPDERADAEVTVRIFVPCDGVRLSERAVRAEPLDLNEGASISFPGRRLPEGQPASLSEP